MVAVSVQVAASYWTAERINADLEYWGALRLPAGVITVTESIVLPEGASLSGSGPSTIVVAAGDFPAIRVGTDNERADGCAVSDLQIRHSNTIGVPSSAQSASDGLLLRGSNVTVANVTIRDCFNGVRLYTDTDAPHEKISLVRVRSSHTNSTADTAQYGLQANTVTGLEVVDCEWRDAWLDGIKLRRNCKDVRIIRGCSSDNGVSLGQGASGDGFDGFAGSEDVLIDGTIFADNGGNGIVFKTVGDSVTLGIDFNPSWGWMRNLVMRGVTCRGNAGSGIALDAVYNSTTARGGGVAKLADTDEDDRPRTAHVKIADCILEENALQGISVNSLYTSIRGTTCRANGRHGIEVQENARDVLIEDCQILGCSTESAGARPAINVQSGAARVVVRRTLMDGADHGDDIEIVDDDSYTGLTVYHRNGVEVEAGAVDVLVENCSNRRVTSDAYASPLVSFEASTTTERVRLIHEGTETTALNRFMGGIGSTYRSVQVGGAGTTLYVKESGAPGVKTGWEGK